jgi:DNA polymerase III subunit chi
MPNEVAFHTGVEDKLAHTCRLLRKAYRQGARVVVSGPSPLLQQLDQALWTFEPQEFVPHVRLGPNKAPPEAQRRTPIWLVEVGAQPPHQEVLVNLGGERRPDDAAFKRIIEIVSRDTDDVAAARRRWKQYEAQGWPITHHAQGAAG